MTRLFRQLLVRRSLKHLLFLSLTTILVGYIIYTKYEPMFALLTTREKVTQCPSLHSETATNTSQMNSSFSTRQRKVIFAFRYAEQLTMATNNLLQLAALAAFGDRQVVVPFVSDSFFYGTTTDKINQTLALYYNITALNKTLRSRGHATMISWKEFQDICKGRLDVLVHLDYTALSKSTTYSAARPFIPCGGDQKIIQRIEIGTTICMNVFALDSVQRFENEAVKELPCVGFSTWMGSAKQTTYRAQFDLESVVSRSRALSRLDMNAFFNSKLSDIAQDFIARNLAQQFISVHIRVESILWNGGNLPLAKTCISALTAHVQKIMDANNALPVFLATDFSEFGSSSGTIAGIRREIVPSLIEILSPLKAINFRPSEYTLRDRGAVAIVEMNILASGKHLVVLGAGSFQHWIKKQFLEKNGNDQARVDEIPWK